MKSEPTITRYADGLELRIPTPAGPVSHFLDAGGATLLGLRLIEADIALAEALRAAQRAALLPGDDPGDMT